MSAEYVWSMAHGNQNILLSANLLNAMQIYRSSHRRCSVREGVLRNFTKVTATCARVSFLMKLQAEACNFIKKKTLAGVSV